VSVLIEDLDDRLMILKSKQTIMVQRLFR